MNIHQNPDLLDRLAGAFALGTLRGGARRRFEALARQHAPVRVAALIWQTRIASLNELQPPHAPPPAAWRRIDNLLKAEAEAAQMQQARSRAAAPTPPGSVAVGWLRSLRLWRGMTAAGALATVVVTVVGLNLRDQMGGEIQQLQAKLLNTPQIEYVAVLSDNKSTASMLVTFDPKSKRLTLQRVGSYQEASSQSLQLWALPPSGGPKSLGVLGSEKVLRLTAGENDVKAIPALAISLEPKGGVPSEGGPTGPVLFKGALIQKAV